MQKLLTITPSGPLLCTAIAKPSHSLGFIHHKPHSRLKRKTSTKSFSASMPAFSAGIHGGGFSVVPGYAAATASLTNKPVSAAGCRICVSSVSKNTSTRRAWTVFREENKSVPVAWLRTSSDGDGFGALAATASASDGPEKPDNGGTVTEDKPVKMQRRSRESPNGGVLAGNPDLLNIPGVGPRNLRKLLEKGIAGVAELKKLYKDKFFGKSNEKMVEYLRGSVGIIHKNHAESIATYIKDSVEEDLKDCGSDVKRTARERLTFCVEGNISVGKTTFLQRIANETIELRDLVEVVPEPIGKWQDIGPDHFNILDAFYAEPQRYAYTFQNYVFVTRVMQERESSGGIKPLRLMERSVFSDRMVFVRAVHEAKWMNEMEISIYDSWFDPVVSVLPGLIPDAFIYLRASPDTCHKRMMLRKRTEEGGVSLDYLHDLHEKHENWLFPFQSGNHGVLSVSKLPLLADNSLPPAIKDQVFYLEGDHMHSSIQKVPALVLDCEPNIDFSRDIEAKREYASQVAQFFEFVKKTKEASPTIERDSSKEDDAQRQPILLSPNGRLWIPNGRIPMSESELRSLDFTTAMSSVMSGK